jgi:VIT1/CCC1 family predicted Fe2+/Mn2+ transporter
MKAAIKTGVNFGLTSGVITTLGLMVGLHAGTHSTLAVVGGIITIAIADSLSDALGIHISKEAEQHATKQDVWTATLVTLITKMLMALSFIVPVLLFDLNTAIICGIIWGMLVLTLLSYRLAVMQGERPYRVITEHIGIALFVILATHFVGDWTGLIFK